MVGEGVGTTLGEGTGTGDGKGTTLGEDTGRGDAGGWDGCGEGVMEESFRFHLLKRAWRLSMAMSWALMVPSVASWMVVDRKLMACRILSS